MWVRTKQNRVDKTSPAFIVYDDVYDMICHNTVVDFFNNTEH